MSSFWSIYITFLTLVVLVGVTWLLFANRHKLKSDSNRETLGHEYDGIEECDKPLPYWWFLMFIATLILAAIYFLLYPGLGSWPGLLGWTQEKQWQEEVAAADKRYEPLFARFGKVPIHQLINSPRAVKMGHRIFANNCALCHGSDARGNLGFPNLVDNDWLYGGDPKTLVQTITHGRQGQMPAWGQMLGETNVLNVAGYVRGLSGLQTPGANEEQGKAVYQQNCAACHGPDGRGNPMLGAPNLTDNIWLYGGSVEQVVETITKGRQAQMPAQKDILSKDQIHLVATFVLAGFVENMTRQEEAAEERDGD